MVPATTEMPSRHGDEGGGVRETELVDELRRLPMRHSVVAQLLTVLDDPDTSAVDVAHALELDPSLSVRVLHLANSPYFGQSGQVANLHRAVVVLGNSVVRSLAVSTAAGLFAERGELMPDGFWGHSLAVAAGAALVAAGAGVATGDALCAGLLHDVGAALAFRFRPDDHARCAAGAVDDVLAAEASVFGGDHAALGAVALEAWQLPAALVAAIAGHHGALDDDAAPLTRCVRAGEALAIALGEAPQLVEPRPEPAPALAAVGLGDRDIDALLARVGEHTGDLGALLAA